VAALALVAVAGLANLPVPFDYDQAFFTVGAHELDRGALLYRDFWDLKQPGVFWFYLAAGHLGGFHEIGIHAFELAWMLGLAIALFVPLRGPAGSPGLARLAAVLTVGLYYAVTGANHLTEVEALVALPTFLCLSWALRASKRPGGAFGALLLSGCAGGVTLLIKLVLLPIPLGIWLVALWHTEWPDGRPTVAAAVRWAAAVALGLAVTLGVAAAVLAAQGVLRDALWTTFVHPATIAATTPAVGSRRYVVAGLLWFVEHLGPALGFALIGAYSRLSRVGPRAARALTWGLVAWVATASLAIVLQRRWWPYHYLLFFVPVGILAAMGVQACWRQVTAAQKLPRWLLAAALASMFLAPTAMLATKLVRLPNGLPRASEERRLEYAASFQPDYALFARNVRFLRDPASLPGPIYVFSNPLFYYLSARRPETAFPGSWYDNYDGRIWGMLGQQLAQRLPAYVFVDNENTSLVADHAIIAPLLRRCYREHHEDSRGMWYERAGCSSGEAPSGGRIATAWRATGR
jgi:hypothetical protein